MTPQSLFDALDARSPEAVLRNPGERLRQRCVVRMLARIVTFGVAKLARAPYPVSTFDIRDAEATGRFRITVSTGYGAVVVQASPRDALTRHEVEVRLMRPADVLTTVGADRYAVNVRDLAALATDLDQYLDAFYCAAALGRRDAAIITAQSEADRQRALFALGDLPGPERGASCSV